MTTEPLRNGSSGGGVHSAAALLLQADALRLPLADASVDLIVTSPPYYNLRAYEDAGQRYHGQLGAETHWRDYLTALMAATVEMTRVLKPSGSIFVNLGDKYASAASGQAGSCHLEGSPNIAARQYGRGQRAPDAREKSLLLLPERYRIACVDELGLIARAVLVWDKPNALPESARDRVRHAHEDWVHLVKQPRYYAAVDEIRQPHARSWTPGASGGHAHVAARAAVGREPRLDQAAPNPLGGLPGSVWTIPTEPLRPPRRLGVDHYAAFPSEWPRRLILGWSPPGVCTACGHGRWPVVDRGEVVPNPHAAADRLHATGGTISGGTGRSTLRRDQHTTIRGYACACTPDTDHPATGSTRRRGHNPGMPSSNPQGTYGRHQAGEYQPVGAWREYHLDGWRPPPIRPAVVLDPFCGTGTTVMVARALGRLGIGLDLSADYLRLARWRVWESGHAAKATTRTNHERQAALFTSEVTG